MHKSMLFEPSTTVIGHSVWAVRVMRKTMPYKAEKVRNKSHKRLTSHHIAETLQLHGRTLTKFDVRADFAGIVPCAKFDVNPFRGLDLRGSKFAACHRQAVRPIQLCSHYRALCDMEFIRNKCLSSVVWTVN